MLTINPQGVNLTEDQASRLDAEFFRSSPLEYFVPRIEQLLLAGDREPDHDGEPCSLSGAVLAFPRMTPARLKRMRVLVDVKARLMLSPCVTMLPRRSCACFTRWRWRRHGSTTRGQFGWPSRIVRCR